MHKVDGYKLALPVIIGEIRTEDKGVNIKNVAGTAFNIGKGVYLTAGHVVEDVNENESIFLGVAKSGKPWKATLINECEINKRIDIAVLTSDHVIDKALPWNDNSVENLTSVLASGYPHAIDKELNNIYKRDFKGYIITRRPYFRLVDNPFIYEVSFPCPKGISGAFLLEEKTSRVCGVVIKSEKTSIDLHYEVEERIETDGNTIHHVTETSTYGIAVSSSEIIKQEFDLLGGSFLQFIKSNNLI